MGGKSSKSEQHMGFVPPKTARTFTRPIVPPSADEFRFAIVSDRTGGARPGVFERALEGLNLLCPDFVISIGDLIEGYTAKEDVLRKQWDEFSAMVAKLDMPFFYIPGNHDLSNDTMLRTWQSRMEATYYAFSYRGVLFLILDSDDPPTSSPISLKRIFGDAGRAREIQSLLETDPLTANELIVERLQAARIPLKELTPAAISDRQVDWVRETLSAHSGARWTMVFIHKPAWMYDCMNFARIQALLTDRSYTLFSGHEHYYRYSKVDERDYLQLGPTGGELMRPGPGSTDHVSLITMRQAGPVIAHVAVDGVFGLKGPSDGADAPTSDIGA